MSRSQYYESSVEAQKKFDILLAASSQANISGWVMIGMHGPTREKVYVVRFDVSEWIETQPSHLWQKYEITDFTPCYILDEELITWMILKWR